MTTEKIQRKANDLTLQASKRAAKRYGPALGLLGEELRSAVIRAELVGLIAGVDLDELRDEALVRLACTWRNACEILCTDETEREIHESTQKGA